jgi:hypothetical protein
MFGQQHWSCGYNWSFSYNCTLCNNFLVYYNLYDLMCIKMEMISSQVGLMHFKIRELSLKKSWCEFDCAVKKESNMVCHEKNLIFIIIY